jgi:DNA-directed RNA polymerase specialized sigma24 family protein
MEVTGQITFEQHEKLLHYVAHRVHRRIYSAGGKSVLVEDIFQELCIAWCLARDCWKPEHGVPFGPYLMRGMSNHINRWVDKELRQCHMAPIDLDAELSENGNDTLHDLVADDQAVLPEAAMIEKDTREFVRDPLRWRVRLRKHKPLTRNAQKFLDLLESPPPSLLALVRGLQARAEYGRNTLKIPSTFAPKRITGSFILDFMGIEDRQERNAIYHQLELLGDRVSQQ